MPTILLAEDQDQLRRMLTLVCRTHGYNVLPTKDGQEALKVGNTLSTSIDLLLSDVDMPSIDGPRLAERLLVVRPRLEVILMSGLHSSVIVSGRVYEVLSKPFTIDSLLSRIQLACGLRIADEGEATTR